MRYIPTSDARVEQLRKQAKKLKSKGGGKHTELLDKVAKQANYDHWHHVILCNERGKAGAHGPGTLLGECEAVVEAETRGDIKVVMTGPELRVGPFVLFSTGVGDAWLLDPEEQAAMCLMWRGARMEPLIKDGARLEITWHGNYELLGDFFHVDTGVPEIGDQAVGGYPIDGLRQVLQRAQSTMAKMAEVLGQFDAVEMGPEVYERFRKRGWTDAELDSAKAEGYRYSPGRDTLLGPVFSSDDEEFLDSEPERS